MRLSSGASFVPLDILIFTASLPEWNADPICPLRPGCLTCKAKRLKCDETKPSCHQCERRKVECGGYKKDFKWRPFEETTLSVGRPTPMKVKKRMLNEISDSEG